MKKLLVIIFTLLVSANADVVQNQQIYAASNVVKSFGCDGNRSLIEAVKHAKAVAILTDVKKIGFIASVQSGEGVFSMRDMNGEWTSPIMIRYKGFGVGAQAGIESRDIIVLFQTSKSFQDIFEGSDTLELNAGASVGEGYGSGIATDLPDMSAWTVSPGEVTGIYAGVSLDFGRFTIDNQATYDYYGRIYDYEDILNGSPKDSRYTKIFKNTLKTYLGGDVENFQCNIDKFIIEN
ncbi:MAG: lipid-binding SYLF domain-containing protein [Campylobacter sp.]|nr:lipid-binding SYLF domain-containing protein [Campylobacter sp.]